MSAFVIGLALFAAILHATWNDFLRSGGDRLWTVTVMSFASTIVALPFVLIYPLPASGAWLYIVLSAVLQVGYSVFLVAAYRYGELGQVYPIVRGTVPLLVTLGGFIITGDKLNPYQIAGVILVAVGIMSLALGKGRASTSSILFPVRAGDRRNHRRIRDCRFHRGASNRAKRGLHGLGACLLWGISAGRIPCPAPAARGRFSRT